MVSFSLACEGVTDQIVIDNILYGYYKGNENFDDDVKYLQPPFDETTKQQSDFGNWELLLTYLSSKIFRDDVLNSDYLIIQIDTDDSQHPNFDVNQRDADNEELSTEELIENIIKRLIKQIDEDEVFYEENKDKIIFAISVHSLECWILPLYKTYKTEKTKNCFDNLKRESEDIKVEKTHSTYDKLSKDFLKAKNITKISKDCISLKVFISKLPVLA